MLNALRLKAGFESDLFTQRTGQSMPAIQQQLNKAQALGLLELNENINNHQNAIFSPT
jgi:coproporphyrinogen III oxidase-like Fe-S oxidoreductase